MIDEFVGFAAVAAPFANQPHFSLSLMKEEKLVDGAVCWRPAAFASFNQI